MTEINFPQFDNLSIGKRGGGGGYDVTYHKGLNGGHPSARVAALRSDFTEEEGTRRRTAIPGTWRIRWEHRDPDTNYERFSKDIPKEIEGLLFQSVHEAFDFYCSRVLI